MVQIQSSRLLQVAGRVVMALNVRRGISPPDQQRTPHLTIVGQAVYANPFNIATISANLLKLSVSVLDEADQD